MRGAAASRSRKNASATCPRRSAGPCGRSAGGTTTSRASAGTSGATFMKFGRAAAIRWTEIGVMARSLETILAKNRALSPTFAQFGANSEAGVVRRSSRLTTFDRSVRWLPKRHYTTSARSDVGVYSRTPQARISRDSCTPSRCNWCRVPHETFHDVRGSSGVLGTGSAHRGENPRSN